MIFLAILASLTYISFIWIQAKIDAFWRERFKPNFLMFPLNEIKITKEEMERVHLLYNYLAITTGIFAIFFTLFICELIELYRSYKKRCLASSNA
jgi:hypothetical protein